MLNEQEREDHERTDNEAECRLSSLHCRRTGRRLPLAEHAQCPYCFGRETGLASGQHERFCDFVPGRDPVHFGFPPDTSRERSA